MTIWNGLPLLKKGGGRVQIDTHFEDLFEGDAAFINTKQIHSAFPIGEDNELYAIVFNEALLRNSSLDNTETKYIIPLLNHDIGLPFFYRAEETATTRREGVIQPLLLHLSHHFHEPMTVKLAAQICCISPNYFCYVFKKATGKTLVEYINMLRIHEAEQLLSTRRYPIQQVALMVGYSNMTYFGRIFKKFKIQTPREYMNSLWIKM